MSIKEAVAAAVACDARRLAPTLVRSDGFPMIVTNDAAQDAIDAVVTQDPLLRSWRVWASVLGAVGFALASVSAVLVTPEAGELFGQKAPAIAAILAAVASGVGSVAALLSKFFDPRPIRQ